MTASMALWSFARLQPESPVVKKVSAWLLQSRAVCPDGVSYSKGLVRYALGTALKQQVPDKDASVTITVNGQIQEAYNIYNILDQQERTYVGPCVAVAGENNLKITVKGNIRPIITATLTGYDLNAEAAAVGVKALADSGADKKPTPSPEPESPKGSTPTVTWEHPQFQSRAYLHTGLSDPDGRPLEAESSTPVTNATFGQRLRVQVKLASADATLAKHSQYLIWEEPLPGGFVLVPGTLQGNFQKVDFLPGRIRMIYAPGVVQGISYEIVAVAPGSFQAGPPLLFDAYHPEKFRMGQPANLNVLMPGVVSPDPYQLNPAERFELAGRAFDAGRHDECLQHLEVLEKNPKTRAEYEKSIARMRLEILTNRPQADPKQIVAAFETLRERHPDLVIPFDKILRIGAAYHDLKEFERAAYLYKAVGEATFLADSALGASLEDNGDYTGSIDLQDRLWFEAGDGNESAEALFALAQSLSKRAPDAADIEVRRGQKKLEKNALLLRSRDLLTRFLRVYPKHELADDAVFSQVNAAFALKDYPGVVTTAEAGVAAYPKSNYLGSFHYMAALGHFWQFAFDKAPAAAAPVANAEGKDRDLARYITGQILHAQGKTAEAIEWYGKVKSQYPDAADSIRWFEQKTIALPEVSTFKPGEPVKLSLTHRNIREAALQVYKVDLMKLYLREKNLSNISRVNLAGISPESGLYIVLGEGKDYADKTREIAFDAIKEEGAYLVICRGDDLFKSGLVLVSPLGLEVLEDAKAGTVRVNVFTAADKKSVADAEVKAIGTASSQIQSGLSDPRGVYEASNLGGLATVIARKGENQYAFHRGTVNLREAAPGVGGGIGGNSKKPMGKEDYTRNFEDSNKAIQDNNVKNFDAKRRASGKGVEVQKAAK